MDDARHILDQRLGVSSWALPGSESAYETPRVQDGPWWWRGDEDASQSFLRAMGVTLG